MSVAELCDVRHDALVLFLSKVERLNKFTINVFGYDAGLHPLYLSVRDGQVINLPLLHNRTTSHFCWIKDFDRLCYDQKRHHDRKHFCLRCLSSFNTDESRQKHDVDCRAVSNAKSARAVMPENTADGPPHLFFTTFHKQLKCPYVIYADTETLVILRSTLERATPPEKRSMCRAVSVMSSFGLMES